MEHPAMTAAQTTRREAPHPHVVRVVAGEYSEGADYTTWRDRGTTDWLLIHTVAGSGRIVGPAGRDRTGAGRRRPAAAAPAARLRHRGPLLVPRLRALPSPRRVDAAAGLARRGGRDRVRARCRATSAHASSARSASCARSSTGSLPQSELFAMNALETALLWLDTQNPLRGRMDERLLRVMEHIGAHLAGDLSVDALARIATLSPSRLSAPVHREPGHTRRSGTWSASGSPAPHSCSPRPTARSARSRETSAGTTRSTSPGASPTCTATARPPTAGNGRSAANPIPEVRHPTLAGQHPEPFEHPMPRAEVSTGPRWRKPDLAYWVERSLPRGFTGA